MSSKIQRKEDNIREGADVIHKVQHSCNIAMLEIEHFFWTLHVTSFNQLKRLISI